MNTILIIHLLKISLWSIYSRSQLQDISAYNWMLITEEWMISDFSTREPTLFQIIFKIITHTMFSQNNKIMVEITATKLLGCLNLHIYKYFMNKIMFILSS